MQNTLFSAALAPHRDTILQLERTLWAHPETGYREWDTTRTLADAMTALGYTCSLVGDIPGFVAELDTGRQGPTLLLTAELDAILEPRHPEADKVTGAVHACGHHLQCVALYGVAAALCDRRIRDTLSGTIRFAFVPAEEPIESEWRENLRAEGKIRYHSGKREFLARGLFDGVDLAMMVHASTHTALLGGAVGSLVKKVTYHGVAAHAGGAPQNGKNALQAATIAINAVNALRETLVGGERAHIILTEGGTSVSSIPARAVLSCCLRAESTDELLALSKKMDAAFAAGALAFGCTCETENRLGLAPLKNDRGMTAVAKEAADTLGIPCPVSDAITSGSTDMGDLSCLMPAAHPFAAGICGETHGVDYAVCDPETACITNAAWQTAIVSILLANGAARAVEIVKNYRPQFADKAAFLAWADAQSHTKGLLAYTADGVHINL